MPDSDNSDTTTHVPDLEDIFKRLNVADFALAQLALDLKDPDKRQEIGIKLVEALNDAFSKGMTFSDVKLKTKAGEMTASLKFPVASLLRSLKP